MVDRVVPTAGTVGIVRLAMEVHVPASVVAAAPLVSAEVATRRAADTSEVVVEVEVVTPAVAEAIQVAEVAGTAVIASHNKLL